MQDAEQAPAPGRVRDLFGLDGAAFVYAAHRVLLLATPDEGTVEQYKGRLGQGEDKVGLLLEIAGAGLAREVDMSDGLWQRWRDHPTRTRLALERLDRRLAASEVRRLAQQIDVEELLGRLMDRVDALQAQQDASLVQCQARLESLATTLREAGSAVDQFAEQSRAAELHLAQRIEAVVRPLQNGIEDLNRRQASERPRDRQVLASATRALDCWLPHGLPPQSQIEALAAQLAFTDEARRLAES